MNQEIDRIFIINYFIKKYNYSDYLEIGIFHGVTFSFIECKNKDSVDIKKDPNCPFEIKYLCSSDKFFEKHITKKYDIIFIDGNHESYQVDIDIVNSLKWLNENGTVILHDCNAPEAEGSGEGTVWKSISKFNCTNNGYTCHVVNVDHGCGIIRKGDQIKHNLSLEQAAMWSNKKLNLISVQEFNTLY